MARELAERERPKPPAALEGEEHAKWGAAKAWLREYAEREGKRDVSDRVIAKVEAAIDP